MEVEIGPLLLSGNLEISQSDAGLVLFAHGSGSGRFSPRNRQVAKILNQNRIGTLLFDLLLPHEIQNSSFVFNIPLLAGRLFQATEWSKTWLRKRGMSQLPISYFGASTGAAAALWAAADEKSEISALVCRGGRVDLASSRFPKIRTPTLLIAGSLDETVLELNRKALFQLPPAKLEIIRGATHLFEEEGALEAVAEKATAWFLKYFKEPLQIAA